MSIEKLKNNPISPYLLRELNLLLHENETLQRVVRGRIGYNWVNPWTVFMIAISAGVILCQQPLSALLNKPGNSAELVLTLICAAGFLAFLVLSPHRYQTIYGITSERIIEVGQQGLMYASVIHPARMRFTLVRDRGSRGDVILDSIPNGRFVDEIGVYDVENPQRLAALIRETYLLPEYSKPETPAPKSV